MRRSNAILTTIGSCPTILELAHGLPSPGTQKQLGGVHGSLGPLALATLNECCPKQVFVALVRTPSDAISVETDLDLVVTTPDTCHFYPQREALPYEDSEPQLEIDGLRVEAIEALFSGRTQILVTTPRALQERAAIPSKLAGFRRTIRVGEQANFSAIRGFLEQKGFIQMPLVEEVGQFAVRGGILDVFSVAAGEPVRIEFWGDEVASIRSFNISDQRSTYELEETHVLPVTFQRLSEDTDERVSRSLLELLPADALITQIGDWSIEDEVARTWTRVTTLHEDLIQSGETPSLPETLFLHPNEFSQRLEKYAHLHLSVGRDSSTALESKPPPEIDRDMGRLEAYLREGQAQGQETLLLCDNDGQLQRLEEILGGVPRIPSNTSLGIGSLSSGFELTCGERRLRVLNDHEIFRRTKRLRKSRRFRGSVALESLAQIKPGDYLVHMDHGVGRFRGLELLEISGQKLEALAIEYAGGEVLRLPVYRLDLVERWVGESEDAKPPSLHRIGGKRWNTVRNKTERSLEEMTVKLLELYARRQSANGFRFSEDTQWQTEMESSFLYEDTPDQEKATIHVKRDMESHRPMDRLICGDVGYGKTEVAVRAAFKAVQDGKQVAVLAPTTILVEQHRHTFAERLADYPVNVGALSRFRSSKEQKEILLGLANGQVDIVVGTHRLLSKDVDFSDLGLLIIDEEQRFGVSHKERLTGLRASIDILSLSATPIPRTLHLSLSGIRDLSLIQTPPRDRISIMTSVVGWTDQLITEALHRELDRGGQAFFLHNRVETIYTTAEELQALIPEANIEVAHGQMSGRELDKVMRSFVEGALDVLVCSSIIENGLDVQNANTLIVDRADRFGLSQLYQIRGRVGRSDRRAYCYLLVPDDLSMEARKRLTVLEHYTELGSGYSIALRDLELRGAGNLLGAEQSGFAQQVGLDTYMRLLKRTVKRLQNGNEQQEWPEPDVSLRGPAYLPEGYISDSAQKLHFYRKLSRAGGQTEIEAIRLELADRFGSLPPETARLLDASVLRILGRSIGVERVIVNKDSARVSFREGIVPRMAVLEGPLRQRQAELEVHRITPLSLLLYQTGADPILETVTLALAALSSAHSAAA